jgi:molybdate transport system ATP-binding protein
MKIHIDLKIKKEIFTLDLKITLPLQGLTVITGNSGCGKTTLLRCLAGLEKSNGTIHFADQVWQDSLQKIYIPTHKRRVGYVFQHTNLFSHLTVKENLEYAFKRANKELPFQEISELLKVNSLLKRYPHSLSGGEKQLVAIARSLLAGPNILLMDEPVSSIDQKCKEDVLCVIEEVQKKLSVPILYVTHSDSEAKRIGNNFVHIENGIAIEVYNNG